MKKLKPILILLFVLFTSLKAIGQSLTYTFIDPCTKEVTYFSIPIQSGAGTTIFFLGQQRYFTANDVASGDFAAWINQSYSDYRKVSPCGVQQGQVTQNQITAQIIGSTVQSVVGSIMSQAKSESNANTDGSDAAGKNNNSGDNKKSKNDKNNTNGSSNGTSNNSNGNGTNNSGGGSQTNSNGSTTSNTTTSSSTNTTTSSSTNTTNSGSSSGGNGSNNSGSSQNGSGSGSSSSQNGTGSGSSSNQTNGQGNGQTGGSSSSSTTQTGGQGGGQAGGQGSGDNTTKTEGGEVAGTTTMTTDAKNDRGTGGSSSGKGGKGGSKGGGRSNPVIISSDLTNAQNLDKSYTGIINVGMSQSSMTGTSSWGVNSMIWFNFKQFALTGRYTKIHYSKDHKLKLIHNVNLTGVYSYGNTLGFLGYSAILNAGKWGITGINVSGAVTKTPDDVNLFISPSATAFYTRPFKVGKKMILSPELYVISTPLIYSSVDKVSVSDRTFSAFIGTGVDYQITKRFKVNMNYKANMSTNPSFPILSFFLIGSKINL
jgi:hypothetical protein